jgi:outer membrane receptor protein involved in Fe transport
MRRLALFAALAITPTVASAQTLSGGTTEPQSPGSAPGEAKPVSSGLGEIVVTAQKRSERLIDVPLAVTVVDSEQLLRRQVNSSSDLANFVPGMTVNNQGAPGTRQISIRGLNTGFNEITTASTVGIYIGDMPVTASNNGTRAGQYAVDPLPYDVANIEVLKGPQGTLYGSNAMGGLVRYNLVRPDLNTLGARGGGSVEAVNSSNDVGFNVRGSLNVPIVNDVLAVRVGGVYRESAGFVDNRNPVYRARDLGASEQLGISAFILFQPTDRIEIRGSFMLQDVDANGRAAMNVSATTGRPAFGRYQSNLFFASPFSSRFRYYNLSSDIDLGFATLSTNTGYAEFRFDDTIDLTTSFGRFCSPAIFPPGCPGFPQATAIAPFFLKATLEKFVQEIRLSSPTGNRLEWMVGGYYTDEDSSILQDIPAFTSTGTPLSLPANTIFFATLTGNNYREKAVFANTSYEILPGLRLGGGVRQSWYSAAVGPGTRQGLFFGGPNLINIPRRGRDPEQSVTTWMATANYLINDDTSVYLRAASGYRPGYFRPAGIVPEGNVLPDEVISYEAGIKGSFLDKKLRVELSAFLIDWSDIQLNILTPQNLSFAGNGSRARSKGFELAVVGQPTSWLQLSGNATYNDAKLVDDALGAGGRAGDRLPLAAKWAGSASADINLPLSARTDLLGGLTFQFRDRVVNRFSLNATRYPVPSYGVFDAYAGVKIDNVTFRVQVKNVFNKLAYTGLLFIDTPAAPLFTPIAPRTITANIDIEL